MFMLRVPRVFALACVLVAALVQAGPHQGGVQHRHHDIAARAGGIDVLRPRKKKRSDSLRCAAKSSSSLVSSSTSSSTSTSTSTWTSTSTSSTWSSTSTSTTKKTTEAVSISIYVAPTTSTSVYVAPTTSTSKAAATTSSSSSGATYTGDATYYSTGLGACGITNVDTDYIAAASFDLFNDYPGFDSNDDPATNPLCNKYATLTYEGKSVTVQITDKCEACAYYDLDLSPSAFEQLAAESVGRMSMTWKYD